MSKENILEIEEITHNFGGVTALDRLSFQVKQGQIYGIIGPNGAGKTTLFNIISGLLNPDKGKIFFKSERIDQFPPEIINKKGLARTFQKGSIVEDMTVIENVMSGIYLYENKNPLKSFFMQHFSIRKREKEMKEKAKKLLDFVELDGYAKRWSSELVWVERQLVQLARALISNPDLLLLDEPAAGMGQKETAKIKEMISKINEQEVTVIVISHNVNLIMKLCDRLSVINFGQKISEGSPKEVKKDPEVLEAYIGEAERNIT